MAVNSIESYVVYDSSLKLEQRLGTASGRRSRSKTHIFDLFFDLPHELRTVIYNHYFQPTYISLRPKRTKIAARINAIVSLVFPQEIFLVSRLVSSEARAVWLSLCDTGITGDYIIALHERDPTLTLPPGFTQALHDCPRLVLRSSSSLDGFAKWNPESLSPSIQIIEFASFHRTIYAARFVPITTTVNAILGHRTTTTPPQTDQQLALSWFNRNLNKHESIGQHIANSVSYMAAALRARYTIITYITVTMNHEGDNPSDSTASSKTKNVQGRFCPKEIRVLLKVAVKWTKEDVTIDNKVKRIYVDYDILDQRFFVAGRNENDWPNWPDTQAQIEDMSGYAPVPGSKKPPPEYEEEWDEAGMPAKKEWRVLDAENVGGLCAHARAVVDPEWEMRNVERRKEERGSVERLRRGIVRLKSLVK